MKATIQKEGKKFSNKYAALNDFIELQFYFTERNFLNSSYVHLETGTIELTVHFELSNPPTVPERYNYSQKEIMSHTYYNDNERRLIYVRCLKLTFEY